MSHNTAFFQMRKNIRKKYKPSLDKKGCFLYDCNVKHGEKEE